MRIEYQISEDDFVSAGKLALRSRTRMSIVRVYFLPAVGALLIAVGIVLGLTSGKFASQIPIVFWGSALLGLTMLRGYGFRRVYRKAPLLREPRALDTDDNFLRFTAANSDSCSPWQSYIGFAENEYTFILFQQGNQIFVPIPKRELSPSQIDEFRAVLAAHLPRR
jgi:hypothetical protein